MASLTEREFREQIVQAAHLLFQAGVMSHSGHGNMSARLPGTEHILLTSGGHIAQLTAEQLAIVTFDGEVVDGRLEPVTREIVGMHSCVYRARDDVAAVIHTHSPQVTSFALAHQPLPCAYEALLRFGVTEDIPVADLAPRGSPEAVNYLVERLQRHATVSAVRPRNHSPCGFCHHPPA